LSAQWRSCPICVSDSDNKNMPFDLFIPSSKLNGAKQGQKAVAKVTDWDPKSKNPVAEIINVLGYPGLHETEMHAILAELSFPYSFTEEVEADAEKIPGEITEKDIKVRRDFRKVPTFTIDPADAKDFDDALSLSNSKMAIGKWSSYCRCDALCENGFTRGRGSQTESHINLSG